MEKIITILPGGNIKALGSWSVKELLDVSEALERVALGVSVDFGQPAEAPELEKAEE